MLKAFSHSRAPHTVYTCLDKHGLMWLHLTFAVRTSVDTITSLNNGPLGKFCFVPYMSICIRVIPIMLVFVNIHVMIHSQQEPDIFISKHAYMEQLAWESEHIVFAVQEQCKAESMSCQHIHVAAEESISHFWLCFCGSHAVALNLCHGASSQDLCLCQRPDGQVTQRPALALIPPTCKVLKNAILSCYKRVQCCTDQDNG